MVQETRCAHRAEWVGRKAGLARVLHKRSQPRQRPAWDRIWTAFKQNCSNAGRIAGSSVYPAGVRTAPTRRTVLTSSTSQSL